MTSAITQDTASRQTALSMRAGFWHRAVAFGIDLLVINLLIAGIGLAATGITGGKLRVAHTVVDFVNCVAIEPQPPGLPAPEGIESTSARRCTRSLGIAHDWTLVIARNASADETKPRRVSIPLDAQGNPVSAFYLDGLIPFVLAVYLLLLEWRFGATLGKRIIGINVHSLGSGPISLVQASKRLLRLVVLLAPTTTQIGPGSSIGFHGITFGLTMSNGLSGLGIWSDVLSLVALGYLIHFIATAARGTLPLHDRWAGTEAIVSMPPSSA